MNIKNPDQVNISQKLLHLSLIDGIGPAIVQKILTNLTHEQVQKIYTFLASDFMMQCDIPPKQAQKIVIGLRDTTKLDQELTLIQKHSIKWTTIADDAYPAQLKEIHLPPMVLYWQGGDLCCTQQSVAVIGARKANHYGQRVINQLIPELVTHGFTIVSGGAIGADTMAHSTTVKAGGKTVVVLGSGLLELYPASNRRLFETIVQKGGILLSAFSLRTSALPGNFPARNRIIAGLSRGCIVVQAAKKSGARITAEFALEQGRDVFAVPGPFDDALSAGCHSLLADGALCIVSANDVLEAYGVIEKQLYVVENKKSMTKTVSMQQKVTQSIIRDPLQKKVLEFCANPCSVNDISAFLELSIQEVQTLLFTLQMSGYIEQDFTGKWVALV